jgi:uncharacterized protein
MNSLRAMPRSFLAAIVCLLAATGVFSQNSEQFSINESPLPAPTGYLNDYVGVIDAETKAQLEKKLDDFRKTSNPSTEIAVAIVKTTGNRDIFDYSLAVYRGWKIGAKEGDNPGALLFIAVDDRKYFTQVSRDLEDELPDSLVGNLQRQYLVPQFKQGNYSKGIADTIDAYIRTIQERRGGVVSQTPTTTPTPPVARTRRDSGGSTFGFCVFIIIGFVVVWLISRAARGGGGRGGRWGGGGFGGGGSALPWIIGSIISSAANSRGGDSGGSSWGGGDWGGGGGFGGFGGGGDAGGGGAGGSW